MSACACSLHHSIISDSLWLSMGFSHKEYWSQLPFPPPGYLPHSGNEPLPSSLAFQVDSLPLSLWGSPFLLGLSNISLYACGSTHSLSHIWLFETSWAAAQQAPLSMEFSRQGNWSGFPFPTSGDLPNPGIKSMSLASPALASRFFTTETAEKHTSTTFSLSIPLPMDILIASMSWLL